MIVEIILPIPVKKTFYYKISDNYQFIPKVGNLVEVDFRNKVLVGIIIKKFNEDTLGKLFLSFIVETIILGKYMKVNPYDQPAVEEVKVLTRKFLI